LQKIIHFKNTEQREGKMLKTIKLAMALTAGTAMFMGATSLASMQTARVVAMRSDAAVIGKMSREEYDRINKQGAEAVAAVQPTSAPLSKADEKLMMEVAMGGMMQLEIGKVAVEKATNEEAKILAQSEVEEQTGLGNKLKEIAAAKNITLPSAPDAKTQAMVTKMQSLSGADFDKTYVKESGVKNHEKLDKTMGKVESKATDPALKGVAQAAHPLVRTHLQVSREVLAKMSGNNSGNNSSGSMNNSSNSNSNANR
jgi:putative membrane protein